MYVFFASKMETTLYGYHNIPDVSMKCVISQDILNFYKKYGWNNWTVTFSENLCIFYPYYILDTFSSKLILSSVYFNSGDYQKKKEYIMNILSDNIFINCQTITSRILMKKKMLLRNSLYFKQKSKLSNELSKTKLVSILRQDYDSNTNSNISCNSCNSYNNNYNNSFKVKWSYMTDVEKKPNRYIYSENYCHVENDYEDNHDYSTCQVCNNTNSKMDCSDEEDDLNGYIDDISQFSDNKV